MSFVDRGVLRRTSIVLENLIEEYQEHPVPDDAHDPIEPLRRRFLWAIFYGIEFFYRHESKTDGAV